MQWLLPVYRFWIHGFNQGLIEIIWKNNSRKPNYLQSIYVVFTTIYIAVTLYSGGSEVKASSCNAGDLGSIPGSGRSPGEGNGNPLQYSSLENPMDGGARWATVHGVAKSRTRLSDFTHSLTHSPDQERKSSWVSICWGAPTKHQHFIFSLK